MFGTAEIGTADNASMSKSCKLHLMVAGCEGVQAYEVQEPLRHMDAVSRVHKVPGCALELIACATRAWGWGVQSCDAGAAQCETMCAAWQCASGGLIALGPVSEG